MRKTLMISRNGKRKPADMSPCEAVKVAFDQVPLLVILLKLSRRGLAEARERVQPEPGARGGHARTDIPAAVRMCREELSLQMTPNSLQCQSSEIGVPVARDRQVLVPVFGRKARGLGPAGQLHREDEEFWGECSKESPRLL